MAFLSPFNSVDSTSNMPGAITNPQDEGQYMWSKVSSDSRSMSRKLTNLERMFVIFNKDLYGQNCPFIGATISLQHSSLAIESSNFNIAQLHDRAVEAFCQTRWRYPTVAARVVNEDTASYDFESEEEVRDWAYRTVSVVTDNGGWLALRERLSRDTPIPSAQGDYCLIYLVVRPDEASSRELTTFDILMHTHHVFTDGSGIRSIMNEFITRLANPLSAKEVKWGQEVDKLLPPSTLLVKKEDLDTPNGVQPAEGVRLKGFTKVCYTRILSSGPNVC